MADNKLPPNFELDPPQSAAGLPPGFELDAPAMPQEPKYYPGAEPSSPGFGMNDLGNQVFRLPRTLQDIGVNTGWRPLDQLEIPFSSQAASALSGLQRAGHSLHKAPWEVGAAFGSDYAQDQLDQIDDSFVPIETRGSGEDAMASVAQIALPGGASAGATTKLGPMAQGISALLSTFLTTDPQTATTVGTAFGGGPTAINAGDGPLTKRLKATAEDAAAGLAATGVGKLVSTLVRPFTEPGRRAAVANQLVDAGVTLDAVDDGIRNTTPLADDGFNPTTAQVVGTQKAMELERGALNAVKGQPLRQRVFENQQSIAQNVDKALSGPEVPAGSANRQFGANLDAEVKPLRDNVASLTNQRSAAEAKLATEQAAATAQARTADTASASIDDLYRQARDADTSAKAGLYDSAAEAGRAIKFNVDPVIADAQAALADISRLKNPDPALSNAVATLEQLQLPAQSAPTGLLDASGNAIVKSTPAATAPVTVKDAIDALPKLSKAIDASRRALTGDTTDALMRIQQSLKTQLSEMAGAGDPAALAWQKAEANFRDNFAPVYRGGTDGTKPVTAKLDEAIRTGNAVPASEVGGKFLPPSSSVGAVEAIESFKKMAGRSGEWQKQGRQYLIGSMADNLGAGKVDATRAKQWLNKYRDAVDAVPGLRQEVQQMINRLDAGAATVGRLEGEIKDAAKALGEAETSFAKSPAGIWFDGDIGKAANSALSDPARMDALVAAAGKDPSGAALQEVKNEIGRIINWDVRQTGATATLDSGVRAPKAADYKVSFDKMTKLLGDGTPSRAALTRLYGKEGVATLDKYVRQLELMARGKSTMAVAGSDTSMNEAVKTAASMAADAAVVSQGGFQGGAIARTVKLLAGLAEGKKTAELRVMALTDPNLARALLMPAEKQNVNLVARQIVGAILNRMVSGGNERSL